MFSRATMAGHGFEYMAIGSGSPAPKRLPDPKTV
jgi:hypothetical protein